MSVLVTLKINGDTDRFRRFLGSDPDRFAALAPEARAAGCVHHRFGVGDGFVLVIDEWESADAFQTFFQTTRRSPPSCGTPVHPRRNLRSASLKRSTRQISSSQSTTNG